MISSLTPEYFISVVLKFLRVQDFHNGLFYYSLMVQCIVSTEHEINDKQVSKVSLTLYMIGLKQSFLEHT